MNGKTMKLLSEYIAEQNRKDRERNSKSGYDSIYQNAVTDTNGVKQDWVDKEDND
jgi:hypothetical protein